MCMEMMAGMAAGQMKKQGQGMPNAQLPSMPGAAPVVTGVPSVGGGTGGAMGEYAKAGLLGTPKTWEAQAIGKNQPGDADLLKKWDELQPERSKDLDLMTLLQMMGRQ